MAGEREIRQREGGLMQRRMKWQEEESGGGKEGKLCFLRAINENKTCPKYN